MRKSDLKRIFVVIVILVLLIIEIIAFKMSKADNILSVTMLVEDTDGHLETQEFVLSATEDKKGRSFIVLPEIINGKYVKKYYISENEERTELENLRTSINQTNSNNTINESTVQNITNEVLQNEVLQSEEQLNIQENEMQVEEQTLEKVETIVESQSIIEQQSLNINEDGMIEKSPDDIIYLTESELEQQTFSTQVEYDTKVSGEEILYSQHLEIVVGENKIQIFGYMPENAEVHATVVEQGDIELLLQNEVNSIFSVAYDIKIMYHEQEFDPSVFDENVRVIITGLEELTEANQSYKVLHITDENEVQEVETILPDNQKVTFETNSFSTYAVLVETESSPSRIMMQTVGANSSADIWDGTVATEFQFGSGTSSSPYLITSGAELAYLASQVNNGTYYANTYFQLNNDIDLNNRAWTPIGTRTISFRRNI